MAIGLRLPQVLVIGGASWNTIIRVVRFPDPDPATVSPVSWHDAVGSSGAGKALNLVRLGAEVTLVAALGDDEAGEHVAATVTSAGIRLIRVRDPAGTSRHLNLMDSAGRRISFQMRVASRSGLRRGRTGDVGDLVYSASPGSHAVGAPAFRGWSDGRQLSRCALGEAVAVAARSAAISVEVRRARRARSVPRTRAPRRAMTTCPGRDACIPAFGWRRDEGQ